MRYKLLAIDLDGTLLDSRGRLPQANIDAVERIRQAGVLVVPCTGRGLGEVRATTSALNITDVAIIASGAQIWDVAAEKTLFTQVVHHDPMRRMVDSLAGFEAGVILLMDHKPAGCDYVVLSKEWVPGNFQPWFDNLGLTARDEERASDEDLARALRIAVVGREHQVRPVHKHLVERFAQEAHIQRAKKIGEAWFPILGKVRPYLGVLGTRDVWSVEAYAPDVNKWSALTWLSKDRGIAPEEIAVIGDNMNDLEMMAAAGCSIAMDNSVPEVLQLAKHRTLSNDRAGVAHAIDQLMTGRW